MIFILVLFLLVPSIVYPSHWSSKIVNSASGQLSAEFTAKRNKSNNDALIIFKDDKVFQKYSIESLEISRKYLLYVPIFDWL